MKYRWTTQAYPGISGSILNLKLINTFPRRPFHHFVGRRPPGQSGLRHWSSIVCNEQFVQQPDLANELWSNRHEIAVYRLPKLDEEVARLHLERLSKLKTQQKTGRLLRRTHRRTL